jgi:hypothetical protein
MEEALILIGLLPSIVSLRPIPTCFLSLFPFRYVRYPFAGQIRIGCSSSVFTGSLMEHTPHSPALLLSLRAPVLNTSHFSFTLKLNRRSSMTKRSVRLKSVSYSTPSQLINTASQMCSSDPPPLLFPLSPFRQFGLSEVYFRGIALSNTDFAHSALLCFLRFLLGFLCSYSLVSRSHVKQCIRGLCYQGVRNIFRRNILVTFLKCW